MTAAAINQINQTDALHGGLQNAPPTQETTSTHAPENIGNPFSINAAAENPPAAPPIQEEIPRNSLLHEINSWFLLGEFYGMGPIIGALVGFGIGTAMCDATSSLATHKLATGLGVTFGSVAGFIMSCIRFSKRCGCPCWMIFMLPITFVLVGREVIMTENRTLISISLLAFLCFILMDPIIKILKWISN